MAENETPPGAQIRGAAPGLNCPGGGNCSGHGSCATGITGSGVCTCQSGFTTSDCSVETPLGQPTVSSTKLKRTLRLRCTVNGITPDSYYFYVKGRRGAAPQIEKRYRGIRNFYDFNFKHLAQFDVQCAYNALGRTSGRSAKKTAQMP